MTTKLKHEPTADGGCTCGRSNTTMACRRAALLAAGGDPTPVRGRTRGTIRAGIDTVTPSIRITNVRA